jgi:hypothetical protein
LADFVDLVSQAHLHQHEMMLWPYRWNQHKPAIVLDWKEVPFSSDRVDDVPNAPGVYAFFIQPRLPSNMVASYLMYIGQTGRTLRVRFQEYLREAGSERGRPKLSLNLPLYDGFLYFYCSEIMPPTDPEEIEDHLIETYLPPWNDRLPSSVSRVMSAF